MAILTDKNLLTITSSKIICFDLPIEFDKSLKHKIEFIISRNKSLFEYTIKPQISQLLFKYNHENDIHEHSKQ